ncbi:YihY/virulence factor BrkB family protein [Holzapfeliella sp. He02]|uniref:YihY/virulence factor BrkB family protein n=1 Tax=Holzapfeliella saturejae TaxID=3082953 RepID=A0ABU8SHA7_9LACO
MKKEFYGYRKEQKKSPRKKPQHPVKRTVNKPKYSRIKYLFETLSEVLSSGEINQNAIVIAYFALFALFPLLLIAAYVLGLFNMSTTIEPVVEYISLILPREVSPYINPIITQVLQPPSGGFLSFGVIVALWAFSGLINSIKVALNKVYRVQDAMKEQSFMASIVNRIVSFLLTATLIIGLISILFVLIFGQQILELLAPVFNFSMDPIYQISNYRWPVIIVVLGAIVGYLYYFLPNISIRKRSIWPGVFLTIIGWGILSQGFSFYLEHFSRSLTNYGIIGTFIIFMLWLNFSALVFLVGAVLNSTIDHTLHGNVDYKSSRVIELFKNKKTK